jgi:hypothetical protein
MWVVKPAEVRDWRVTKMEDKIAVCECCCMVWGLRMNLWMRRREWALSDRRAGMLILRPTKSSAVSSARLLTCDGGGVEVTKV